jgi:hypothetical protein
VRLAGAATLRDGEEEDNEVLHQERHGEGGGRLRWRRRAEPIRSGRGSREFRRYANLGSMSAR